MNLEFPIDFTFTASNLHTFQMCKHKFYLRYVKHVPWPAQMTRDSVQFDADRDAGIRFHQLLHQFFLGFDLEQLSLVAMNDPDSRISDWFQIFLASPYAQLKGELQPEKISRCVINHYPFMAKFDLIQRIGNQITIYDWKTSRKPPVIARLKASIQTKLYPLVLNETSSEKLPIQFVYWEINQPESPFMINIQESDLERSKRDLMTLCDEIARLEPAGFIKTQEVKCCVYCEYRSLCDRGKCAASIENMDEYDFSYSETFPGMKNEDGSLV